MCHKRCVPALDEHWECLERILLPRFVHIVQLNINSIHDCDISKFQLELGPHYVKTKANC